MASKILSGAKTRRRNKNEAFSDKRELLIKETDQEYAQVFKMLGNGRLEAYCTDGVKRLCHIRGKMRKKVWINVGDIVLISLRTFQDERGDVIHKYNPDEIRTLKQMKELPEAFRFNEAAIAIENYMIGDNNNDIEFTLDAGDEYIDIEKI